MEAICVCRFPNEFLPRQICRLCCLEVVGLNGAVEPFSEDHPEIQAEVVLKEGGLGLGVYYACSYKGKRLQTRK